MTVAVGALGACGARTVLDDSAGGAARDAGPLLDGEGPEASDAPDLADREDAGDVRDAADSSDAGNAADAAGANDAADGNDADAAPPDCWQFDNRALQIVASAVDGDNDDDDDPARDVDYNTHECALRTDGTVCCWGSASHGELGNGEQEWEPDNPVPTFVLAFPGGHYPDGLFTGAVRLTAGGSVTCALMADGTVDCWGRGDRIGNGHPNLGDVLFPAQVVGLDNAVGVSAGDGHACALRSDGAVLCWGSNALGQLGVGSMGGVAYAPLQVPGIAGAIDVEAGGQQTCALLASGSVLCWGYDFFGMGDGQLGGSTQPVPVSGVTDAVGIAVGRDHACALLADTSVVCWGAETSYFGNWDLTPVPIAGLMGATALSAGYSHTCALVADGSVQCWGWNRGPALFDRGGELGDGQRERWSVTPVSVVGLTGPVTSLGMGGYQSNAVLADRTVMQWGTDDYGFQTNTAQGVFAF